MTTSDFNDITSQAIAVDEAPTKYPELMKYYETTGPTGWLEIPIRPPINKRVWHYTSANALESIIRSGKMRATSTSMLNDREEIKTGLKHLRLLVRAYGLTAKQDLAVDVAVRAIDKAEQDHVNNRLYVVCASTRGDDLSQWRGYGAGYAIQLETTNLVPISDTPYPTTHDSHTWRWGRVLYGLDEWRPSLDRLAYTLLFFSRNVNEKNRELKDSTLADLIWLVIPYLKHDAFRGESEVRLVYKCPQRYPLNFHAAGRYGITPFIECGQSDNVDGKFFSQSSPIELPLTAVRVGPTVKSQSSRQGARSLLDRYGYDWVPVKGSSIPYR